MRRAHGSELRAHHGAVRAHERQRRRHVVLAPGSAGQGSRSGRTATRDKRRLGRRGRTRATELAAHARRSCDQQPHIASAVDDAYTNNIAPRPAMSPLIPSRTRSWARKDPTRVRISKPVDAGYCCVRYACHGASSPLAADSCSQTAELLGEDPEAGNRSRRHSNHAHWTVGPDPRSGGPATRLGRAR